jgi:hypothetical protein
MYPYLTEQLAKERIRELRATTARATPYRKERPRVHRSARQRAGWALVWVGLRLAGTAHP